MPERTAGFALSACLLAIVFHGPLVTLISLGLRANNPVDQYSQVAFMPIVSLYLILRRRKDIFADSRFSIVPGTIVIALGLTLMLAVMLGKGKLNQQDYATAMMPSLVVLTIGDFVLFFGTNTFRAARFPLLILALMIPAPSWLWHPTVGFLQQGSAMVTAFVFKLTSVPFVQDGLVFHLPRDLNIRIASECSGIRSSIALLIASLAASDIFLRKGWTKLVLNLAVLPLSLFKNGLRIVALSLLSIYVDRGFMFGDLHRKGGIVFYLIAVAVLTILLWVLWKLERRTSFKEMGPRAAPTALVGTAEREKLQSGAV